MKKKSKGIIRKKIWLGLDDIDAMGFEDWTDSHHYQGDWSIGYCKAAAWPFFVIAPNNRGGQGHSIKDAIVDVLSNNTSPPQLDTCGIRD